MPAVVVFHEDKLLLLFLITVPVQALVGSNIGISLPTKKDELPPLTDQS